MKIYNVDAMFEDKTVDRNTKFVKVDDIKNDLICIERVLLKGKWDKECPILLTILNKQLSQSNPSELKIKVGELPNKEGNDTLKSDVRKIINGLRCKRED